METRCSFRFCPILFLKKAPAYHSHLWVEEGRLEVEMEAIRKAERSPVAFNSQFICSHLYSLPFGFSYLFFPTTFICSNFPNISYFHLLFFYLLPLLITPASISPNSCLTLFHTFYLILFSSPPELLLWLMRKWCSSLLV